MFQNDRNPEIKEANPKSQLVHKISDFSRALATNQERVYDYITFMVRGDHRTQQQYTDFIFSHLRNLIENEINTNILKYASRFITTLLLIGNPHLYQEFVRHLLPVFKEKVKEDYRNKMKPIWPIQQFCSEVIFLLASWLPNDFYDHSKPSVFMRAVQELQIVCHDYRFINIDKLIISYRILKALKLDSVEEVCICQKCQERRSSHFGSYLEGSPDDKKKMRERLYLLQFKNVDSDSAFKTGFEIQLSEEISQLQNMLENKMRRFQQGQGDSLVFYRLQQKIDLLEDHLGELKHHYNNYQKKRHQESSEQLSLEREYGVMVTPAKKRREVTDMSTADKSTPNKSPISLPSSQFISSGKLKSVKSLPQLVPCQQEFQYHGYSFFQNKLSLSGQQMQQFKLSLLRFDQKIYLQKDEQLQVYCILLARKDKVKIRVLFGGDERLVLRTDVEVTTQDLNCTFDPEKYEFTIRLQEHFEPIELCCKTGKGSSRIVLPLGFVKLLEPLPDSAKETERLTFKLEKTVKLQNRLIDSYESLVGRLSLLEKTMERVRSAKITRLFQNQKLKKRLERRYLLLGSEILLRVVNHHTQYVEIEVSCEDRSMHRSKCSQLMKELIFICSGEE